MREKFKNATQPDYHEQEFIRLIEKYYTVKKSSFAQLIFAVYEVNDSHHRRIRKYIEKYNNNKFDGITPLGKIITVDDRWELVRSDNPLADKVRNKARYNLICSAIDYHNTMRILGNETHHDQIDMYSVLNKSLAELIEEAKALQDNL